MLRQLWLIITCTASRVTTAALLSLHTASRVYGISQCYMPFTVVKGKPHTTNTTSENALELAYPSFRQYGQGIHVSLRSRLLCQFHHTVASKFSSDRAAENRHRPPPSWTTGHCAREVRVYNIDNDVYTFTILDCHLSFAKTDQSFQSERLVLDPIRIKRNPNQISGYFEKKLSVAAYR